MSWQTNAIAVTTIGIEAYAPSRGEAHAQAQATVTKHVQKNGIPMCAEGQQVTNTCACGTDASGRPFRCQEGQWCRTFAHACTQ